MKNVDFLPVFVGDRFDLMALLKNVWIGRKIVFWTFGCFVLTGLLLALFSPVKYESTSVLLPQEEEVQELGQLGGLASLAGINLGDMLGSSNALSTDLYPNILGSYPFLQKLASSSFVFEDEEAECTLYDKLASEPKNSGALVKYTVGLPWTLKDWLSPVDTTVAHIDDPNAGKIVALSREDILLLKEKIGRAHV